VDEKDVLFFCHRGYQPVDFKKLQELFKLFQMRPHFLDYGHYSTKGSDSINIDHLWESYHGKSTIIAGIKSDRVHLKYHPI